MSTNFYFQKFVNNAQQYFAITPEASFPIIWIFTEGEGDGIESRLPNLFYFTTYLPRLVKVFCERP